MTSPARTHPVPRLAVLGAGRVGTTLARVVAAVAAVIESIGYDVVAMASLRARPRPPAGRTGVRRFTPPRRVRARRPGERRRLSTDQTRPPEPEERES